MFVIQFIFWKLFCCLGTDFVKQEAKVDKEFIEKCYKIKADLRETHLSIGTDNVNYRTCSQDAYTHKKAQYVDPAQAAAIVFFFN